MTDLNTTEGAAPDVTDEHTATETALVLQGGRDVVEDESETPLDTSRMLHTVIQKFTGGLTLSDGDSETVLMVEGDDGEIMVVTGGNEGEVRMTPYEFTSSLVGDGVFASAKIDCDTVVFGSVRAFDYAAAADDEDVPSTQTRATGTEGFRLAWEQVGMGLGAHSSAPPPPTALQQIEMLGTGVELADLLSGASIQMGSWRITDQSLSSDDGHRVCELYVHNGGGTMLVHTLHRPGGTGDGKVRNSKVTVASTMDVIELLEREVRGGSTVEMLPNAMEAAAGGDPETVVVSLAGTTVRFTDTKKMLRDIKIHMGKSYDAAVGDRIPQLEAISAAALESIERIRNTRAALTRKVEAEARGEPESTAVETAGQALRPGQRRPDAAPAAVATPVGKTSGSLPAPKRSHHKTAAKAATAAAKVKLAGKAEPKREG